MPKTRFRKGMHIKFRGRECVIEQRLPNRELQLRDIAINSFSNIPELDLINSLFEGQLEVLDDGWCTPSDRIQPVKSLIGDLVMLKDDDPRKKEAKRRYAYIKGIQASNLARFTQRTLEPLIEKVAQAIGDHCKPHWKTVYYQWFRPFITSGGDIRVLVPCYEARGNREPKFTGRRKIKGQRFSERDKDKARQLAQIVDEVINEEFLNEQRLSVQGVYDELERRIAEINEFRDFADQLPLPSISSLYDRVQVLDEYEADAARLGKRYAEHKHRCAKRGPRPTRPLERVEIDHTTLDLFVLDDEVMLPVGRPTVTAALDKYSRANLGIYVSFDGTGYSSVMQCLLHAITPKTYLKTRYPKVTSSWDTYGIPELVVVDNGPEFHSRDFEDACLQLGTAVLYSPPKAPWYKGSMERYFGTLNRRLVHRQPGTTFSNIIDKKDYDPKRNARISFSEFMEVLHVWIVDIYHQSIHKGLKAAPAHVWEEGIARFPPAIPLRQQDLPILIGHVEYRTIGPSGIELYSLFYNSEELAALRSDLKGEKVALKVNPEDISTIYAYDPKNARYVHVPALDQEYTRGLRRWQHDVIKNYARKIAEGRVDRAALMLAKRTIQEIVDSEWPNPHRSGHRARMARWNGVRQQNKPTRLIADSTQTEHSNEYGGVRLPFTKLTGGTLTWAGVSDIGQLVQSPRELEKVMRPIVTDDEELDMAGYSSSFNLPAGEHE